jgi:two-component system sensor histidine kinase BasS
MRQIARGEELERDWLTGLMQRLDRIAREGARMVNDVLAIERLGRRPAESDVEVSIEEILAATIPLHAEALRRAGCDLFIERDPSTEAVRGRWDGTTLRSLLSNLLQNVARHAAGAPVRIHLSRSSELFRIRISDGGPGLPEQKTTAPDARTSSEPAPPMGPDLEHGHGLGMWIIHQAVADLGGQITMHNGPKGGLLCEIWLPLS